MGINTEQFYEYLVKKPLNRLARTNTRKYGARIDSYASMKLLMLTAAVESDLGTYVIQNDSRMDHQFKAKSPFQIENDTLYWLFSQMSDDFKLFINEIYCFRPSLWERLSMEHFESLIHDFQYAAQIARLIYWYKTPDPMPDYDDNEGMWLYYKKWWNTKKGDTDRDEFFAAAEKHRIIVV